MARRCCQTKKGGLTYVESIRTYSGGHEWCEAETQCVVVRNAGGGEARSFCRGDAREKLDAPETPPDEMGGISRRSCGGLISTLVSAALFFAGPGYAPAQYDAADCTVADRRPTTSAASGNRARGSHGGKNFHARQIDCAIVCSESGRDRE